MRDNQRIMANEDVHRPYDPGGFMKPTSKHRDSQVQEKKDQELGERKPPAPKTPPAQKAPI